MSTYIVSNELCKICGAETFIDSDMTDVGRIVVGHVRKNQIDQDNYAAAVLSGRFEEVPLRGGRTLPQYGLGRIATAADQRSRIA